MGLWWLSHYYINLLNYKLNKLANVIVCKLYLGKAVKGDEWRGWEVLLAEQMAWAMISREGKRRCIDDCTWRILILWRWLSDDNTERSMLLKEGFITYTPQENSAAKECGATWDSTRFSQGAGKSKRKPRPGPLLGFLWGIQSRTW